MKYAKTTFTLHLDSLYTAGEGYTPVKRKVKLLADNHKQAIDEVMADPFFQDYKWVLHATVCVWSAYGGWNNPLFGDHYWIYYYNPIEGLHKSGTFFNVIRQFKVVDAWTQNPKSS